MTGPAAAPEGGGGRRAAARILAAVTAKRAGLALEPGEIAALVSDYVAGRVPDYQMAAWLATVACRGMNAAETAALARAYAAGGRRLRLGDTGRPVVDKHSTGGVGDTVSLVAVPVAAACGVAVAKMSGRGLGIAGGTLDKLESVRGLRLDLGALEVRRVLGEAGMVITGQSDELAPGDRATYALRDVTATVDSVPLIAASIIGKKLAFGARALTLDVKTGAGALIPDHARAVRLARTMVDLAEGLGLRCRAVLTDMSQPLGHAVGNALEVKEALSVLRGEHVPGLSEVSHVLAGQLLLSAEPGLGEEEAGRRVRRALRSGAAHETFLRWARAQGADARVLADPGLLPSAPRRQVVRADRSGWVAEVDPRAIGSAALLAGAGRLVRGAALDHAAGVVLRRRVGDPVSAGEALAELHHTREDASDALARAAAAFTLADEPPAARPLVHGFVGPSGRADGTTAEESAEARAGESESHAHTEQV
ncbi:thymidine phosphorylase [Streptomyces hoynatensis]|uniref:Thymidine phosphorylase n=1 Tax=Streptomyces hoynatensis TaxID=1141874 RepID=A0A3A9Z946_9ACTN|nr:thymidine phosphorylase [Streptomyces hoynatensis]RKN44891.1 thymidine phosphorylase [Streptomyces hoynatensis]